MKKVYISIPITGEDYSDQRNHAFVVATNLAQKGYDVITPFDIIKNLSTPYNECMGKCIEQLLECDIIYLCRDWQSSKGCKAEMQVALVYDKDVMTE